MHVTSAAGTDLAISLQGATCGGNWGYTTRPGTMTHWPGVLLWLADCLGSCSAELPGPFGYFSLKTTSSPPTHKNLQTGEIDNTCRCRALTYVEIQVCKTRDLFCKLAFIANLSRCWDIPERNHFQRTDTRCPLSRAKKCPLSRAGRCRVEREVSFLSHRFFCH